MTITDMTLQKRSKERYNIFLDGEYAFPLYGETVYEFRLKIGLKLTAAQVEQMRASSDEKLCFAAAIKYLSRRRCTEQMIRDYLQSKEYFEKSIDSAVVKLKSYRYIDDNQYASDYARENSRSKGMLRVRRELAQKGIADIELNISKEEEEENCLALAEKFLKNRQRTLKEKQRLYRHLQYRGFDMDTIYRVVASCFSDGYDA